MDAVIYLPNAIYLVVAVALASLIGFVSFYKLKGVKHYDILRILVAVSFTFLFIMIAIAFYIAYNMSIK